MKRPGVKGNLANLARNWRAGLAIWIFPRKSGSTLRPSTAKGSWRFEIGRLGHQDQSLGNPGSATVGLLRRIAHATEMPPLISNPPISNFPFKVKGAPRT